MPSWANEETILSIHTVAKKNLSEDECLTMNKFASSPEAEETFHDTEC